MKNTILLLGYFVFCQNLHSQTSPLIQLEIAEDTANTFFNHLTCLLDIDYPDSLTFISREGSCYVEGKIGNHDWVMTHPSHAHLTCEEIPVYPGQETLFTSIYEVLRLLDSSEINQLASGGSYILFRYRMEGVFTQWHNTNPSSRSTWYSNIDTLYLPPCTQDDLIMFFSLRNQINLTASFIWLNQSSFSDEELLILEQAARTFPNSVLSDVSLWYTTNFKYLLRKTWEGLDDTDKEELKQELENMRNNTKSAFLITYLTHCLRDF